MIILSNFVAKASGSAAIHKSCTVEIDGQSSELFFTIKGDIAANMPPELPIVPCALAALIPAMERGAPLHIKGAMDAVLLHRLNNYTVPLLCAAINGLKPITITADTVINTPPNAKPKGAVTGMSCGVDSTDTFARYSAADVPERFQVRALAVFDVGSFGTPTQDQSNPLKNAAIAKARAIAKASGRAFFTIESNLHSFYQTGFAQCVSMLNAACANALSEVADMYLGASSIHYSALTITSEFKRGLDAIDAVLYPTLSHPAMEIMSSSAGVRRLDKIRYILEHSAHIASIDVCTRPLAKRKDVRNCGTCHKCGQFLMVSEASGKLDRVAEAFDMEEHRRRHWRVCQRLVTMAKASSEKKSADEVLAFLQTNHYKMAPTSFALGSFIGYASRVIPFVTIKQIT